MRELKIKQDKPEEIYINDIDIRKHLVIATSTVGYAILTYSVINNLFTWVFDDGTGIGDDNFQHKTIKEALSSDLFDKFKVYEI